MKPYLITGGSSAAGIATAQALTAAGHPVLTVGSDPQRIAAAAAASGAQAYVTNLADAEAVAELHQQILGDHGPVAGVIHLVGGWRGGGGIPEQSDADWEFLEHGVIRTLQVTSREFYAELLSNAGRLLIVSSTGLNAKPGAPEPDSQETENRIGKITAGNANYLAAKAAAETWTLAVAQGLAGSEAAAVILRVKSLLSDSMRTKHPERSFPGYTHVTDLAHRILSILPQDAQAINGTIWDLTT